MMYMVISVGIKGKSDKTKTNKDPVAEQSNYTVLGFFILTTHTR